MSTHRVMSQVNYFRALAYDVEQLSRALRREADPARRAWVESNLEAARDRLQDAHRRIATYGSIIAEHQLTAARISAAPPGGGAL